MRGTIVATGIAAAIALGYALSCAVRPFRDCWMCDGKGHHRSRRNAKLSRPCWWCKGAAKRLRLGRRAWNKAREKYRDA